MLGGRATVGEQRKQLEQAIQRWRAELINLTRQNRLLYFRHWPVASLEISIPNSETIHQYLSAATRAPTAPRYRYIEHRRTAAGASTTPS